MAFNALTKKKPSLATALQTTPITISMIIEVNLKNECARIIWVWSTTQLIIMLRATIIHVALATDSQGRILLRSFRGFVSDSIWATMIRCSEPFVSYRCPVSDCHGSVQYRRIQSQRKQEINRSESETGSDEIATKNAFRMPLLP
mmetsp:Transcript_14360/g.33262  ORF Transcript_14360/g.33262 Transcript_14360/m.33262 type:complete len:145 (-) Transcript_14360:28-462(-)